MSDRYRRGVWMDRHLEVEPSPLGPLPVSPRPVPQRVRHAVITPVHPRWYRVMRAYYGVQEIGGTVISGLWYECIGEFANPVEANTCARNEIGRAVVNDWHSKVLFRNGQPIEERA